MKADKVRKYLSLFIGLVTAGLVTYQFILFTPFLLDRQDRNVVDKFIDFYCFGWHLTKGSVYKEYLKNEVKAQKEFGRAAWHREIYLRRKFNLEEVDLKSVLDLYKELELYPIQEQIYAEMLKEEGHGISFYREAGKTFMVCENWKKAVDAYSKVIDEDQDDEMDFYYLGLSYWNLKHYEKAENCFKKVIELSPDFADSYYRLGLIAQKEGNRVKAQKLYKQTLDILPNHLDSLRALKKLNNP